MNTYCKLIGFILLLTTSIVDASCTVPRITQVVVMYGKSVSIPGWDVEVTSTKGGPVSPLYYQGWPSDICSLGPNLCNPGTKNVSLLILKKRGAQKCSRSWKVFRTKPVPSDAFMSIGDTVVYEGISVNDDVTGIEVALINSSCDEYCGPFQYDLPRLISQSVNQPIRVFRPSEMTHDLNLDGHFPPYVFTWLNPKGGILQGGIQSASPSGTIPRQLDCRVNTRIGWPCTPWDPSGKNPTACSMPKWPEACVVNGYSFHGDDVLKWGSFNEQDGWWVSNMNVFRMSASIHQTELYGSVLATAGDPFRNNCDWQGSSLDNLHHVCSTGCKSSISPGGHIEGTAGSVLPGCPIVSCADESSGCFMDYLSAVAYSTFVQEENSTIAPPNTGTIPVPTQTTNMSVTGTTTLLPSPASLINSTSATAPVATNMNTMSSSVTMYPSTTPLVSNTSTSTLVTAPPQPTSLIASTVSSLTTAATTATTHTSTTGSEQSSSTAVGQPPMPNYSLPMNFTEVISEMVSTTAVVNSEPGTTLQVSSSGPLATSASYGEVYSTSTMSAMFNETTTTQVPSTSTASSMEPVAVSTTQSTTSTTTLPPSSSSGSTTTTTTSSTSTTVTAPETTGTTSTLMAPTSTTTTTSTTQVPTSTTTTTSTTLALTSMTSTSTTTSTLVEPPTTTTTSTTTVPPTSSSTTTTSVTSTTTTTAPATSTTTTSVTGVPTTSTVTVQPTNYAGFQTYGPMTFKGYSLVIQAVGASICSGVNRTKYRVLVLSTVDNSYLNGVTDDDISGPLPGQLCANLLGKAFACQEYPTVTVTFGSGPYLMGMVTNNPTLNGAGTWYRVQMSGGHKVPHIFCT